VFLAAICDALGVSEAWLLSGRGAPYREVGPAGDHVTPREAAVAVRASLRELERRMVALEGMLEYPRLDPAGHPEGPEVIELRPPRANGFYEAGMTAEDSGPRTTRPGSVRTLRLRQRA